MPTMHGTYVAAVASTSARLGRAASSRHSTAPLREYQLRGGMEEIERAKAFFQVLLPTTDHSTHLAIVAESGGVPFFRKAAYHLRKRYRDDRS